MMPALTFDPLYGYLYAAAFIALVPLPFAIFMWWREARKPGVSRKRAQRLKTLDDHHRYHLW
jgi:hypothetical protein